MGARERFDKLFGKKPLIGMVHLTGCDPSLALQEAQIYADNGFSEVLLQSCRLNKTQLQSVLEELVDRTPHIHVGINIGPNEFRDAFEIASQYGLKFIHLNYVSGRYKTNWGWHAQDESITLEHDIEEYLRLRQQHPNTIVLGGVWPRNYQPLKGATLDVDIARGMELCDALIITPREHKHMNAQEWGEEFKRIVSEENSTFPLLEEVKCDDKKYLQRVVFK